jgi:hypothetical protein
VFETSVKFLPDYTASRPLILANHLYCFVFDILQLFVVLCIWLGGTGTGTGTDRYRDGDWDGTGTPEAVVCNRIVWYMVTNRQ